MKRFRTVLPVALAALALASCSNDPTVTNGTNTTTTTTTAKFVQVDRVGKPGIKELYLPYAKHDAFQRAAPTTDVAQVGPQIGTFVTVTGGRSAAISQYAQALLLPDALVADVANSASHASYLGYETSGQIASDCTGTGVMPTSFGGRSLTDDVVNTMLGITFGSLATSTTLTAPTPNLGLNAPADDGAEKDGRPGTPNLTNQDVSCAGKGLTVGQFPYLGAPL